MFDDDDDLDLVLVLDLVCLCFVLFLVCFFVCFRVFDFGFDIDLVVVYYNLVRFFYVWVYSLLESLLDSMLESLFVSPYEISRISTAILPAFSVGIVVDGETDVDIVRFVCCDCSGVAITPASDNLRNSCCCCFANSRNFDGGKGG